MKALLHVFPLLAVWLAACAQPPIEARPDDGRVTPSMLRPLPGAGFEARVLFTVGDRIGDYQPPGILDGLAAWRRDAGTVRVLATHELAAGQGYPYRLGNGVELTGSRVSYFDIDIARREIRAAGLAYERVRDRRGAVVTRATQINERGRARLGFEALCSAAGYRAGEAGFVDDIFFVHEEVSAREAHPHGGTIWALDVRDGELWALPALGRGSWENSAALAAPEGWVALLLGDDIEFGRAPLYLWLGRKQPGGDFPARNGLRDGQLHVWVADGDAREPADFSGTGSRLAGRFLPVAVRDAAQAGAPGHDADGFLDDTTLRERAWSLGAFVFSRPEDLHANPADRRQAVLSSTGHGHETPADDWGTLYLVDVELSATERLPAARATLTVLHDGDDYGDFGIRSADNLVWARDGLVYVQEDRATKRARFGADSGLEAAIWQLDPKHPERRQRIAEIDRDVILPPGARDAKAATLGAWESSGIIDVSDHFGVPEGEQLLLATVQAHGLRGGPIGGDGQLVEGGQLILMERDGRPD